MGRRFPMHLGGRAGLVPGQYMKDGLRVLLRCPTCGGVHEVTGEIDRGGNVAHRMACPSPCCPWIDYVQLESFEPVFDTSDVKGPRP